MTVQRVEQEDKMGCGLACLAMLTGETYRQVKSKVVRWEENHGVAEFMMKDYLVEQGYASAMKYPHSSSMKIDRTPWPPAPFADVHFVCLDAFGSEGFHYVIMLRDGSIIDPWFGRTQPRRLEQYGQVMHVCGVVKINP